MIRTRLSCLARASLAASTALLACLLASAPAAAQDDPPPADAPPAVAPSPVAAVAAPAPPREEVKTPSWSIALERVGGIAYAKATASEDDSSVSVTAFGVGGVTPNPFAIPRVGVDYITSSGLTLGAGVGFSRISGSAGNGKKSEDIGSVTLYTLTPRIGYRIPLSDRIDFTPRAGLTLAGASVSPPDNGNSASIFAVAVGADAPLAFRLTPSFNLLAGAAFDYTVSASVTTESTSRVSPGPGGGAPTTRTNTEDVKGSLFSLQAWLGVGGYL
jgi:hypothetical protein